MTEVLYTKELSCPVCGHKFAQTLARSSLCVVERRDSDFRVQYRNCNPNWYAIIVCPECGYASSKSIFGEVRPEEKEALKGVLLGEQVVDLTGKRSLEQVGESYRRAIACTEVRSLSPALLAALYLKAAWVYREMGETEQEHNLLKRSLESYLEAYDHEQEPFGKMSLAELTYLIGELSRRTKRYEEAVIWFSKVVEMDDVRPNTLRLAREMWHLAKDAYRRGPAEHSLEEVSQAVAEAPVPKAEAPAKKAKTAEPRRRIKAFIRTRLYNDQIEWLEKVGRWWGGEPELEASSIVRALIDLVEDLPPQRLQVADEEELKKVLAEHINSRIGGGLYLKQG